MSFASFTARHPGNCERGLRQAEFGEVQGYSPPFEPINGMTAALRRASPYRPKEYRGFFSKSCERVIGFR
jgi:hypothetical protein